MASQSADMAEHRPDHEFGAATATGFGHDRFRWLFGKGRAPKLLLRVSNQVTHGGLAQSCFGKPVAKSRDKESQIFVALTCA